MRAQPHTKEQNAFVHYKTMVRNSSSHAQERVRGDERSPELISQSGKDAKLVHVVLWSSKHNLRMGLVLKRTPHLLKLPRCGFLLHLKRKAEFACIEYLDIDPYKLSGRCDTTRSYPMIAKSWAFNWQLLLQHTSAPYWRLLNVQPLFQLYIRELQLQEICSLLQTWHLILFGFTRIQTNFFSQILGWVSNMKQYY